MTAPKRKLIEVAIPLEAINRESAREKSIRFGHPSTLHLWWARRPLASCRAVLFAQLVDDPSSNPSAFPTEDLQKKERQRLFQIIEKLVVWENIHDAALLREANEEILKSSNGNPPAILDPFAGGGSIPLEALRLGLKSFASDLNPIPVVINKSLIEIPGKWKNQQPVNPMTDSRIGEWTGARGLAEDVLHYGLWMRERAHERIGSMYPKTKLANGESAEVIAWIWARTIKCTNPACGISAPLVKSWWLSKKAERPAYVVPSLVKNVEGQSVVKFEVSMDPKKVPSEKNDGTVSRNGATCFACGTAMPLTYVREEGVAHRMGAQLMAVVAAGNKKREYATPTEEHEKAAQVEIPINIPDSELSTHPQYMGTPRYGLTTQADLFTPRQLTALACFSDLVLEARQKIYEDAVKAGLKAGDETTDRFENGGSGAAAYADSAAIYLAFAVDRCVDYWSSLCGWHVTGEKIRSTFGRQALSMVWDYAETAPFSSSTGNFGAMLDWVVRVVKELPTGDGHASQADATTRDYSNVLVSTDPPYYDNVPYADLSDFFYGWMRRSLNGILPNTLSTVLSPKSDELVADSYRHGGKKNAETFFEDGFKRVFANLRIATPTDYPVTVFYAFRQTDSDDSGTASTGWQSLLEGMMHSGWEVTATWPIRTELGNRMRSIDSNALASSIVLALRPRSESAEVISRRNFLSLLKSELPSALAQLQEGSIAPVDLAQAAIGPGMAVFSRYAKVLEVDGTDMTVRTALALINQVLDEVLSEQEGDFDSETRFCLKWFQQYGWNESSFGEAESLAKAINTSITSLERGGIFKAVAGKAKLVRPEDMSKDWDPSHDKFISIWEVAVRIAFVLQTEGIEKAAEWNLAASSKVELDAVKELSYLLFSISEKKGWHDAAILFNGLGTSWIDLHAAAQNRPVQASTQTELDLG
jgi:putative DNA methylase